MIDIIEVIRTAVLASPSFSALNKFNFGLTPEGTAFPYARIETNGAIANKAFKDGSTTFDAAIESFTVSIFDNDISRLKGMHTALDTVLDGAELTLGSKKIYLIRRTKGVRFDSEDKNKKQIFHAFSVFDVYVDR